MDQHRPIFVNTGQLSAGKSTVAKAVLARFPFGYHVDVDGIREMVTSGLASPLEWTDETERQFDLAIAASVGLAKIYQQAGFAVAIEGGLDPRLVERALADAGLADRRVGIVLHPPLDVALRRNRERQTKAFDTSVLEGGHARDRRRPGGAGRAARMASDRQRQRVGRGHRRASPFLRPVNG